MNLVDQNSCKMIIDTWMFEKKRYVIVKNDTFGKSTIILAKSIINERIDERKIINERTTAGHTQLPGRGVANVSSLGYLSGNTTSERLETATAHTGERFVANAIKASC